MRCVSAAWDSLAPPIQSGADTPHCRDMSITVLKLGGSLLDLSDLPDRLRAVIARLENDRPLLICGGGKVVDVVRRWHETHALDDEQSHWLAMDSIRLNQRLLLTLMPELELASNRAAAESAWLRGRVPLLDLMAFVSIEESYCEQVAALPHTWNVTSDSLAAWVAIRWPASRFVLLKSVELPNKDARWTLQTAADAGFVDRYFPKLTPSLPPTFWCDLRCNTDAGIQPLAD
ncbi:MAG: hypothetical protein FJ302_07475 [Planctomycetes bacterium]|nr:hypothetical protein [Planctomycetota bacterium]